jgi:monovalent cation:proton antiporter-2 (CPA2) family protein
MHGEGFFFQAFVYLCAAVVAVPVAKRLGLGSVLGYLIAGIAIGPFGLRLVGEEGQDVMHFAEFGVVMMLFLVGLELQPSLLWRLRAPILGLGGLQVTLTAAIVTGIAMALGLAWQPALAIGLTLALSSTAIVLQTLNEKGLLKTHGGQSSFSVLLFQDIAVIPMLALMPLLATASHAAAGHHGEGGHGTTWIEGLPAWGQTLAVLGAVAVVILAGLYLVRPLLRVIAGTRLRELFTAAALLLVIGIALLMTKVGLSPALGTFLAGVVLANSEYRHELESDVDPFKGLLLGLFFIAVGASIDFRLIAAQPGQIAALVAGLVAVKLVVLFILGKIFKLGLGQNLLFTFALAQGGEFGFVLFSFASSQGVLDAETVAPLVAVVALSMALTPLLMLFQDKVLQPLLAYGRAPEREPDAMEEENPVLIAGFGRFGHIVARLLRARGVECTVLDIDSDQVEMLRKLGLKVFYGDASRHDLLHSAGAGQAKLFVVAVDDPDKSIDIVETVRKHFPELEILARAFGRPHAYELMERGVQRVYRETLDSSLALGIDALTLLGERPNVALRAARAFRRYDERTLAELAELRHDRRAYIDVARERIREIEGCLERDVAEPFGGLDQAWDTESIRREVALREKSDG